MTSALAFLGLALTDAMNPFTVASLAVLLTLNRPYARGAIFVGVTFAVYLVFAVLLAEGFTAAVTAVLPMLPVWAPAALLFGFALLCIGFAIHLWLKTGANETGVSLAAALTLPGTAVFAIASTLTDAPTAVPLFAAVAQLPQVAEGRVSQYLWLVAYTVIYVAPLLLLLGLRRTLGSGADAALTRVAAAVNWSFKRLLPPVLVLAGAVAGWIAAVRLLTAG
jgi:hypothetical protein